MTKEYLCIKDFYPYKKGKVYKSIGGGFPANAKEYFTLVEKPVSEDLEQAAKTYAKKESHGYEPCNIVETFKVGANWQKEQIFKDAVICVVEPRYNKEIGWYLSPGIVMNEQNYKVGDRVKVIVIKEEE